jgi:putative mRNA 3-end processing factor
MPAIGAPKPSDWVRHTGKGLCIEPGGFFIDPVGGSKMAVITHGHSDHARAGHAKVLATPETLAIMAHRIGEEPDQQRQASRYGETVDLNGAKVRLEPAGHVLGSAQVVLEWRGSRVVVSGDYKRRRDPTCPMFTPQDCDVFITEATFGLPVFRHPPDTEEIARLLHTREVFPERCVLVGVYALGKCQRVIRLLREAGYDAPIYLHGALIAMCELYEKLGVPLGPLLPATGADKDSLRGQIVLAPPSAIDDRWTRRLPDPVMALASGWMRVKQRAKQRGVELPLVISDHCDWDELTQTIDELGAEVWVTHGREEGLVHYAQGKGLKARALDLVGYDDEDAE